MNAETRRWFDVGNLLRAVGWSGADETAVSRKRLLKRLPKQAVGAEIGVWKGDFSAAVLQVCRPRRFFLIDPWAVNRQRRYRRSLYGGRHGPDLEATYRTVTERFSAEIERGQVTVIRKTSSEALAEFPDDFFDFVYVDGDHSYEGVRSDLAMAKRKVKAEGLICGDDYSLGNWWKDGVVRAVHELLGEGGVKLHFFAGTQYALQKLPPQSPVKERSRSTQGKHG